MAKSALALARNDQLIGVKFGRLTVIGVSSRRYKTSPGTWRVCKCDCGKEIEIARHNLVSGRQKSCGCYASDVTTMRNIESSTHGHTRQRRRTPEYNSWSSMISRCRNPRSHNYPDYGGRGITVCDRWNSFESFMSDMGARPPNTTLDRVDNDGNYEPSNCRWATAKQQRNNQRPDLRQRNEFGRWLSTGKTNRRLIR